MESIDIVTVAPMAGRRAAAMQTASVRARCGAGHERQQETGLSLIELLVAMTVAAVLLSVAIPSYRAEEHTAECQSLMRTSYAVFGLKQNNNMHRITIQN